MADRAIAQVVAGGVASNAKDIVTAKNRGWAFLGCLGGATLATFVVMGPGLALTAIGFTQSGITAGSIAAQLMSASATTGYGAGMVAALQSAGATACAVASTATAATAATVGGAVGLAAVESIENE